MKLSSSAGEMMKTVEDAQAKASTPDFQPGDTIKLQLRVPEGDKERVQMFEGVVLGRRGGGSREMVVVRKISFGIGVERIFPLHSPFVTKIEVVRRGRVRRAKLYFLREKTGKHARLKQEFQEEAPDAGAVESPKAPTATEEKPAAEAPAPAKTEKPPKAEKAAKAEKAEKEEKKKGKKEKK